MPDLPLVSEVADGVFRLARPHPRFGTVNSYVLAADDAAYLIDTACLPEDEHEADGDLLLDFLASTGVPVRSLAGVVLTHGHRDHAGAGPWLARSYGVALMAGRREIPALARDWKGLDASTRGTLQAWLDTMGVDRGDAEDVLDDLAQRRPVAGADMFAVIPFDDGQALPGTSWRVLATAGHTPGHISLLNSERSVVITGDAVLPPGGGNAYVALDAFSGEWDPLGSYLSSLTRLATLGAERPLCGHSDTSESVADLCARHRRHHVERLERLLALVDAEAGDTFGLAAADVGPDRLARLRPRHRLLLLSETAARLEHLRQLGNVDRQTVNGRIMWQSLTAPGRAWTRPRRGGTVPLSRSGLSRAQNH